MKKQFVIIALGLFMGATVLESCKKGANDPGLSWRSRKGRMAGDWKVSSGEGSINSPTLIQTWTYDGSTESSSSTFPPSTTPITGTQTYTIEYLFEKDGTFKMTKVQTAGSNTSTDIDEGNWNFTGKVGDDKNKDHIVMYTTKSTYTTTSPASTSTNSYTGTGCPTMIMYIDRLSNKEVIFTMDGTDTDANGTTTYAAKYTLTAK